MNKTLLQATWRVWLLLLLAAPLQIVAYQAQIVPLAASMPDKDGQIIPTPLPEPNPCPDWAAGTTYVVGQCVSFDGISFECIQAHTSQVGWEPPNAPALWNRIPLFDSSWQPQTFYALGTPVMFQNTEFQARQAHTSQLGWEPPNVPALWAPVARVFAPYVDLSRPGRDAIVKAAAQQGVNFLSFASINAQNGCGASWFGSRPVAVGDEFGSLISTVRTTGGDVIVSFGGRSGTDLALACPDAVSLEAQYQAVIDTYGVTMVDFDVEGAILADPVAKERLNIAVAGLIAANPGLTVSYTLPVVSTGLADPAKVFLDNARFHGVQVQIVNIMTRDFEISAAPQPMLDNVIQAVDNAITQVIEAKLSARIGITPMIGQNDSPGQTFTEQDAQVLLQAAQTSAFIGRLSMWSITRDQQCNAGSLPETCSGVPQQPFDFSRIFASFH